MANLFSERIPDWLGWALIAFNFIASWLLMKLARSKIKYKAAWLLYPALLSITLFFSLIVLILWVGLTGSHEGKPEQTAPAAVEKNGAKPASTETGQ